MDNPHAALRQTFGERLVNPQENPAAARAVRQSRAEFARMLDQMHDIAMQPDIHPTRLSMARHAILELQATQRLCEAVLAWAG